MSTKGGKNCDTIFVWGQCEHVGKPQRWTGKVSFACSEPSGSCCFLDGVVTFYFFFVFNEFGPSPRNMIYWHNSWYRHLITQQIKCLTEEWGDAALLISCECSVSLKSSYFLLWIWGYPHNSKKLLGVPLKDKLPPTDAIWCEFTYTANEGSRRPRQNWKDALRSIDSFISAMQPHLLQCFLPSISALHWPPLTCKHNGVRLHFPPDCKSKTDGE